MTSYTDLLVKTPNPQYLDSVAQQLFAGAVCGGGMPGGYQTDPETGAYIVRVFGDPGFAKFAIKNQGYGEVVGERTHPIPAPISGETP